LKEIKHTSQQNTTYATRADFCRIFAEDMKDLYLLSLLLTADPVKAEQCFVAGLDGSGADNQVFKEWARSWARRTIIKKAISLIAPDPAPSHSVPVQQPASDVHESGKATASAREQLSLRAELSILFKLGAFERFAFVMSVLEVYTDHDCALLLGCTRQALVAARGRALQQIANSVEVNREKQADADIRPALSSNRDKSIVELVFPARLATPA